jgi:3-hydroxyisobutyrate dehydrogenase-like beta-hydroxyacid dehydrogenase
MTINSVGIVGAGVMGSAIAGHLLKGGYRVCIYDVLPERTEALANRGARPARSPKEVAKNSELVLVVVLDDAQVKEVCLGSEGVMEGAQPSAVVAICSTVQPRTCREISEKVQVRGIHVLDTPMARGAQAAVEGKLLLMVGGDTKVLDRCRPVFITFASDIYHLGELGSGQVGKMVNNLILWTCLAANREGLILAKNQGVDISRLREVLLHSSADNWALREWHRVSHQSKWDVQKDLHGVLTLAEESQTPVPISALIKEVIKVFGPEDAQNLLEM